MKLHIQHRLAEACISWGDYLRLGAVSFLQLQQESYACTLEAQPEYLLLYVKEGTMYLVRNRVEAMYSAGSLLLLPPEEEYRLHFAREKPLIFLIFYDRINTKGIRPDSPVLPVGLLERRWNT